MATIQPNFHSLIKPAHLQASRLETLQDKSAYNDFVDGTLQRGSLLEQAPDPTKALAKMAVRVGKTIPDSENRFTFLKTCFDAAASGAVASHPGGPAAIMAKVLLDILPNVSNERQREHIAGSGITNIAYECQKSEAAEHANAAFEGAEDKPSRTAILMNGLGVIADLGMGS